jgi:hypothetical protein
MAILINTVMVICFLTSLFWVVADVTGNLFFKAIVKITGVIGIAFPIIYFLKIYEVI